MKAEGYISSIGKGLYARSEKIRGDEVANGSVGSESLGIPLQPVYARKLILKLLAERPIWQRLELCKRLQADHVAAGNTLGNQDPLAVTKKTLSYLKDAGYVQSDGRGNWSLIAIAEVDVSSGDSLLVESPDNSTSSLNQVEINGCVVLGEGAESVYLYYFETEKELALLKGQKTWQCKIGRTSGDVNQRVLSQA